MREASGNRRRHGSASRFALLALAALLAVVYIAGADGRGPPAGDKRLTFLVRALGIDENGKTTPLRDASVGVLPGESAGTDRNGYAAVSAVSAVNAGDYVTFVAEKEDYKSVSVRMLVDRDLFTAANRTSSAPGRFINYLLGRKEAVITLTLQPEEDAGPTVNLVVQVKDEDLKPVQGAVVTLQGSNPPFAKIVGSSYTSEGGEASYPTLPRELIEAGLQVRVYGGKYGKRFSDVPESVLRGKGQRVFLVVLGGGEKPTWSGTWKRNEVPGTMTLNESGGSVSGSWTWNDGTGKVSGTNKDGRLTGRFSESCCSGSFDLHLSGKSFSGSYTCSTGCNGSGSFSGTCTAGACLNNR